VARELGCDWHTVNGGILTCGEALLEADTDRIGQVTALGMDATSFARGLVAQHCSDRAALHTT